MLIKLNNAKLYKYSNHLCTLIIILLIIEYVNYTSNHRRSRLKWEIPLLEQATYSVSIQCYHCYSFQDPNRGFMSDNVWISMSFCYSSSVGPRDNHRASVSAVMSARLFGERSGMSEGFSFLTLSSQSRSKCRATGVQRHGNNQRRFKSSSLD